jgi:hypothetical protein
VSDGGTPPAAPSPVPPLPAPTLHEAERGSGASGVVLRGAEITIQEAVVRRQAGGDVVVCGPDTDANRRRAEQVEAQVGPYVRSVPHKRSAGPRALPHFQQQSPDTGGHTFYKTNNLRAAGRRP